MGEHNVEQELDERELHEFMQALLADLRALAFMLDEGGIESGVRRTGAEQEMFLIDRITQVPLIDRKAKLRRIVSKRKNSRLLFTIMLVEGKRLFAELEKQKLEGMVAKRADSFYVGDRTRDG